MGMLTEFKRSKIVDTYLGLFLTPGRLCIAGEMQTLQRVEI